MSENETQEKRLNALLSRYRTKEPGSALAGRILSDGVRLRQKRARVSRWLTGAGLIGIGLAGALSGAMAVMVLSAGGATLQLSEPLETAFGAVATEAQLSEIGEIQ